jgi:GR25 family glycosyltransferase involved in LPS biosynthesis
MLSDPGFAGVIVINLERRKDRLDNFLNSFRKSDMNKFPLYHLRALDSSAYLSTDLLKRTLTPAALDEWKDLQEGSKTRKHGAQIPSLGAVACYRSHMNAWRFIAQQGKATSQMQTPYLVCEDDLMMPRKFLKTGASAYGLAKSKFTDLPVMCKYHAFLSSDAEKVGENLFVPNKYWGMAGYALSPYDAMHLLSLDWMPVDVQLDARERQLRDQGKLHVVLSPLAAPPNANASDVQIIDTNSDMPADRV